jgi:hypothetical protein
MVGEGCRVFGRIGESRAAWERMAEVAQSHGLHEFVMKSEVALRELASGVDATRGSAANVRSAPPGARVKGIIRAIAEMRTAAGLVG